MDVALMDTTAGETRSNMSGKGSAQGASDRVWACAQFCVAQASNTASHASQRRDRRGAHRKERRLIVIWILLSTNWSGRGPDRPPPRSMVSPLSTEATSFLVPGDSSCAPGNELLRWREPPTDAPGNRWNARRLHNDADPVLRGAPHPASLA